MRSTLTQAILAAFCAILCAFHVEGGRVMLLGLERVAMAGGTADPLVYYLYFDGGALVNMVCDIDDGTKGYYADICFRIREQTSPNYCGCSSSPNRFLSAVDIIKTDGSGFGTFASVGRKRITARWTNSGYLTCGSKTSVTPRPQIFYNSSFGFGSYSGRGAVYTSKDYDFFWLKQFDSGDNLKHWFVPIYDDTMGGGVEDKVTGAKTYNNWTGSDKKVLQMLSQRESEIADFTGE